MMIEYHPIPHTPDDLRCSLTPADIVAVCARAFGPGRQVTSARELPGGEYNTTYLVHSAGEEPVILRVAPVPGAPVFWHEESLMRREHSIQPYFAPIATLMARTLSVDFTHQIIDRDYLFQTCMPGEWWAEDSLHLPPTQDEALWRQLARIARTIHSVQGVMFGYPHPGPQFASWSLTVLDFVAHVIDDITAVGLDPTALRAVYHVVQEHMPIFDEITRPCLSHGDLWPFNMLIDRSAAEARISAVLDADRAWWCDPQADWTAHLFKIKTTPRMLQRRRVFWEEYGPPEAGPAAALRSIVYDAMHTGSIVATAKRRNQDRVFTEAHAAVGSHRGCPTRHARIVDATAAWTIIEQDKAVRGALWKI